MAHCILNQNTVVSPLARAKGPYKDIVNILLKHDIGVHQMPCPEFRHLGIDRKPMSKSDYDTKEYRKHCRELSEDTLTIIKEYLNQGYDVLGILGINESPTCSLAGEKGIFMEELLEKLGENDISFPTIDVPADYDDENRSEAFISGLEKFITK